MRTQWIFVAALSLFACKSSRVQNEPGSTAMAHSAAGDGDMMAEKEKLDLPSGSSAGQAKTEASPLENHIRDLWSQLDGVRDKLATDPNLQARYGNQATAIAKDLAEVQRKATEDPAVTTDADKAESLRGSLSRIEVDINNLETQVGA